MKELLEDIAAKLRASAYTNEEHVRLALVARLLQALGWDIWNPQEVNTEFGAVPNEDSTRVDIALFAQRAEPAVYVEVKAVGRIGSKLPEIERQMRDYNRNNNAMFSVLTDGRKWRFYLSRAGGEFSQKCFKVVDLLDESEGMENIELAFDAFLSKEEIVNGRALHEAEQYLNSTKRERVMLDSLPMARRDVESQPELSLTQLLVRRVAAAGHRITEDEALKFIRSAASQANSQEPYDNTPDPEAIPEIRAPRQNSQGKNILLLRRHGRVIARGYKDTGGRQFVVLAGSRAAAEVQPSGKSSKTLRKSLLSEGIFRKEGDALVLTRDYAFSSWSNAAVVFLGVSASGPREWNPE